MANLTAATESLIAIVSDIKLTEEYWDDLLPALKLLAVMRHAELAERLDGILPAAMKTFAAQADDEEKDRMVRRVCRDVVIEISLYQQGKQN